MKIGVVLNHEESSLTGVTPPYRKLRELAVAADELGLDSVWLFDHLIFRDETDTAGIWECWTLLSALAEATEKVELGTVVLGTPFRNPALLAKMAHTLDEVSDGRLILGIGAGWHKPEFDAFGYPFDHRVGRFIEALQIIRPLLRGESVTFSGKYYQVEDCLIKPLGPRSDGIPLMIGAGRPRMMRLTAEYADLWNTAWLGDPEQLAERLTRLDTACNEVGRDRSTIGFTVGISVDFPELGETEPWARQPLSGTAEAIADAFRRYEEAGADHLLAQFNPFTLPALEKLAEAIHLYRGNNGR